MCSNRLFILSSFGKLEVATQTNKRVRERMNSHKNAKLTPRGREEMVRLWRIRRSTRMRRRNPLWNFSGLPLPGIRHAEYGLSVYSRISVRGWMRPNGRRAPPCSLRSRPPSGDKPYPDVQNTPIGAEYSAPMAKAVLTQKTAPQGRFWKMDCFNLVRPEYWGQRPQPPSGEQLQAPCSRGNINIRQNAA